MNPDYYERPTVSNGRFRWIFIVLAIVFGYYIFQLFNYQILNGSGYLAQADENRTREISEPTQRGLIYDRNGIVLANNVPAYHVTITPAKLPDSSGATREIFDQLAKLLNMPISTGLLAEEDAKNFTPCYSNLGIIQIVQIAGDNWPFQATRLKCDVSKDTALVILEHGEDWPGINIEIESVRSYPTGIDTAELIGFLGPIPEAMVDYYTEKGFVSGRDRVGYMGVENSMQDVLGGTNGKRVVEVTVGGEIVRDLEEPQPAVPGDDIYLTIDYPLQRGTRSILENELRLWNEWRGKMMSTTGVVIVREVKTGKILTMVSVPSYENNRMTPFIPGYYYNQLSIDDAKPMLNKAISSELPPGSVFKLVTATGAMNEGVVTPETSVDCPGVISLKQTFYEHDIGFTQDYVCWDRAGHGNVDFLHGIAWSCNIFFYKLGGGYEGQIADGGLGIWRMSEYAHALGYGQKTGIELPGEADGLIPNPTWKRLNIGENWATGDTYLAAVGQGFVLATPLQVLNSISTLANDGKFMQVSLIDKVMDSEGNLVRSFEPQQLWDITVDPKIAEYSGNNKTGVMKTVEPWVIDMTKRGMEMVIEPGGTASKQFDGTLLSVAGKTGTAEYCDDWANSQDLCKPGNWPSHAWFSAYSPADDPEISVVVFVYNGLEGSSVGAPIARKVLELYYSLKDINNNLRNGSQAE